MNSHSHSDRILFILACMLLGFASLAAQIILFREMMVAFYGNELTLGVMLGMWLFWVGLGSALGNKIVKRFVYTAKNLALWYFLISITTLMTVVLIRFSKQIMGIAPAEIVGFLPMFGFALLAMSPLCLVLGITFVLNSKSWAWDETFVFSANRVYLWESLGAALAGLVVTFALIPNLSNFSIAYLLVFLNIAFSILLLTRGWKQKTRIVVWTVLALVIAGFFSSDLGHWLDRYTAGRMWRDLHLVSSKDTRYGKLAVTRQQEQITFYENGLMLFSYPDEFSAEEAVHFALLEHPHPRSLLLIGGGMGGPLSQALQYDSLKIDYVEIDPELINMGREYLPEPEKQSLVDPRVRLHLMDGRLYVSRNVKSEKGKRYDVIIVNLPDPSTAQINRLYTEKFFRMIRSTLNENGVFSFRISSAENYISRELSLYLSSLYQTLSCVFEEVKVLPGENAIFLASNMPNLLFDGWQTMIDRLVERNIETQFVSENFLPDRFSPLRMALLKKGLSEKEVRINSDLKPICYFYNSILWSKQFRSLEKTVLLYLSGLDQSLFMVVIAFLFILLFSLCICSVSRSSHIILAAIFVAGFTSILVEIIVVLSFQIFHGYIYSMIGLIFTLFMLGLFLGAMIVQKIAKRGKINLRNLIYVQMFQTFFLLVLLIMIYALAKTSVSELLIMTILMITISISGILGGALFALANHLFLYRRTTLKAGTGYAVDLFGSAFGSLLTCAILIPLLGIPTTLAMILLINLICLSFILILSRTI